MSRLKQIFPVLISVTTLLGLSGIVFSEQRQEPESSPQSRINDKPYQRWLWEFEQRAYPLGYIPDGARLRALRQIEEWKNTRVFPLVQGDRWINIGPAPILGGQLDSDGKRPVSGRVADVAIDPADPNHWLIGAAQGGIWETRDAGQTWAARTDDQESLAMGAIAFAPSNPSIVYAGTGEAAFGSNDVFGGAGLLKSTDGGTTWNTINPISHDFTNSSFADILVDPSDPKVLIIAVARAGRRHSAAPVLASEGIWKSNDGGNNWEEKELFDATDLEVDPRAGRFFFQYGALGDDFGTVPINRVIRSSDAWENSERIRGPWQNRQDFPGGVGRIELALAPSNPNILYVSIQDADDDQPPAPNNTDNQLLGLWRTDNAWAVTPNWVGITNARTATNDGRSTPTPGYCGDQCDYDHEIIVDPSNADTLYAGGIPLWRCDDCRNGADATWTNVVNLPHISDADQSIHVDQHSMAWTPAGTGSSTGAFDLASRSISFEINQGQADSQTRFLARGLGYTLSLYPSEAALTLQKRITKRNNATQSEVSSTKPTDLPSPGARVENVKTQVFRMKFIGANGQPRITGDDELPGKVHYLIGNDPNEWRTDVRTYGKVRYREVYPGIDLVFYGNQQHLEFDFVVSPGADPGKIELALEGADTIDINDEGNVILGIDGGEVQMKKPVVYQLDNPPSPITPFSVSSKTERRKIPVKGRFVQTGEQRVGFDLGDYDRSRTLVIDPKLVYSTYLGGSSSDDLRGMAVDGTGNVYVTGMTFSTDFPTKSAFQASPPSTRAIFVSKISTSQSGETSLVYSTYLGGNDDDQISAIAVDTEGKAYLAGSTLSVDFPTTAGAFDRTYNGQSGLATQFNGDVFVTILNPAGNALTYSTYIGGSNNEQGEAGSDIAVRTGFAYIAGRTSATDFPTINAFQPSKGEPNTNRLDAFVAKIDPSQTGMASLVFSTFLGGESNDRSDGIAVDAAGNAYVVGITESDSFPLMGPFQSVHRGVRDAFVTKLSVSGSSLVYSTYLGGTSNEQGRAIAVDDNGNAYVTGITSSTDFPTENAFQPTRQGSGDSFVTKLSTSGSALVYSTYLGGSASNDAPGDIAVHQGKAVVIGSTGSDDFPIPSDPNKTIDPTYNGGSFDGFVSQLSEDGSSLIFSTFLGGGGDDFGVGTAVDPQGNIYVGLDTSSEGLPIVGSPLQPNNAGRSDVYVAKIVDAAPSRRLVVGNDGGVWSTTDGGRNWDDHNTNLAITQFYAGSVSDLAPDFALGGSQDNGTELWEGNPDWKWINGGDGGPTAISSTNADAWAISSQRLHIHRVRREFTADFQRKINIDRRVDLNPLGGIGDTENNEADRPFIGRFEKCPSNDNIFIAGTNNLWRTDSFFDLALWDSNGPEMGSAITAIAFAPSDGDCSTYAFGTFDGQLRLTTDGHPIFPTTWIDIDPPASNRVPNRTITDIAFDPLNSQILYVTLSGFDQAGAPGHLFKYDPSGNPAWTEMTPSDPTGMRINIPHNTIAVDPIEPNQIFVGTDIGVWRSTDAGANWVHLGPATGMPNVAVFDLQIGRFTSQLVAFTHGRGAFRFAPDVSADLTLTKTDSADPVFAGDPIRYTITVKSHGPDLAPNVTVRDWLPPGMIPVAVNTTQGSCMGTSPIVCSFGNMANGAMVTFTVDVTASTDPGTFCNFARVSSPAVDLNPRDNEFNQCTTVLKEADLSITKTDAPDPVTVVQDLTYSITVTNNGPNDASAVNARDVLPPEVTFVSASSSQGSCTGTSTVNCFFGNVVRGATATATIVVKAPSFKTTLSNTATVSGNEEDRNTGNNTAGTVTAVIDPVGIADLAVTKTDGPDPVQLNGNITYTIEVRNNNGPNVANGVVVTDTLPAGVILLSASSSRGPCAGANPVTCDIGTLVPGESATVTVVVQATAAGILTNSATGTITGPELDPDTGNNTATAQTTVQGPAGTSTTTTTTTIPGGSQCDTDGSGEINVLDIQQLINRMLNGDGGTDLNNDGQVNVLDLQILINVVLGVASCPGGVTTTITVTSTTTSTTFPITTTIAPTTSTTSTTTTTTSSTTSTTSSTTTTTTPATTTTSSTTTTTMPGRACDLFGDDFSDGSADDWGFRDNGTWQVVNGALEVSAITSGLAVAEHGIPVPNFFRLTIDMAPDTFDGSFYGFEPFSNTETFQLAGRSIDGLGAAVFLATDGILKAAFLGFDVVNSTFVIFNATDFGAITSLGIEWRSDGVTLIVNGTPRLTFTADSFGVTTLAPPSLELLDLYSTGGATQMHFDNVCQSSLAALSRTGTEAAYDLSSGSTAARDLRALHRSAPLRIETVIVPAVVHR